MGNAMSGWEQGMVAPADGNAAGGSYAAGTARIPSSADSDRNGEPTANGAFGTQHPAPLRGEQLGPNLERLEEERPDLVNALCELVRRVACGVATAEVAGDYDYALGCKTCQAQLVAAQAELKDEKAKTQTLGRARDDARAWRTEVR
jgi:hypothetical protein